MAELTRRDFLKGAATSLLAAPALLGACTRPKKILNILNWAGYIANEPLVRFEQQTGITVNYDVYFNEEAMMAKLAAKAGYDLIVAPGYLIPRLKADKLIAPVPHDKLPRLANIAKRFSDPDYDRGLAFSVPYLWGTTGLGFYTARFSKKPDSWWILWEDRYRQRLTMLDDPREAIQCALLMLGLPMDSGSPEHLGKVKELLIRQRPLVKEYSSSSYAEDLAGQKVWLAQAWSGDVLQAARENAAVDYAIPKEGAAVWIDSLCFGTDKGPSEEALRLIDYVLQPGVAAEISNAVRYATPNEKALPLLEPALRNDQRAFPSAETSARLKPSPVLDAAATALWQRTWQEIRSS